MNVESHEKCIVKAAHDKCSTIWQTNKINNYHQKTVITAEGARKK